jgi:hypothetical protein
VPSQKPGHPHSPGAVLSPPNAINCPSGPPGPDRRLATRKAGRRGRDEQPGEPAAEYVEQDGDVLVLPGVDTKDVVQRPATTASRAIPPWCRGAAELRIGSHQRGRHGIPTSPSQRVSPTSDSRFVDRSSQSPFGPSAGRLDGFPVHRGAIRVACVGTDGFALNANANRVRK